MRLKPGRAQKLATGFGGGVARQGLACGALTGAAMAVGLALGRTKPKDQKSKDRVYSLVTCLEGDFIKKAGAFNCREITRLDFRNPVDQKRYTALIHKKICTPLVLHMVERTVRRLSA